MGNTKHTKFRLNPLIYAREERMKIYLDDVPVTNNNCFACPYSLPVPPVEVVAKGSDWRNIKMKTV